MAYLARCKACESFRRESASASREASDGSGLAPLNKLSKEPSELAGSES
jgi:hypothetical protein